MVDNTCAMSMHSQDRSLLTNNSQLVKKIFVLIIAIKIFNHFNREKIIIALVVIITRLICSTNLYDSECVPVCV